MSWESYNQIKKLEFCYRASPPPNPKRSRKNPETAYKIVEASSSNAVNNFLYMSVDGFIQNVEDFLSNMVFIFYDRIKPSITDEDREQGYLLDILASSPINTGQYIVSIEKNGLKIHTFSKETRTYFDHWLHIEIEKDGTIIVPRNESPDQNKWSSDESVTVKIVNRDDKYSIDEFLLFHRHSSASESVVKSPKLLMDVLKVFFKAAYPNEKKLHVEDKARSSRMVGGVKYIYNIRKMFELLLVKCSTVYTQYGFKPIDGSYVFSLSDDIVINITVKDGVIYLYGVKYELPDFLKQYIQPVLSTLGAIPAFWFIKEGEEQFLESIRTEQHPPKVTLEEFIKENTLSKLSDSDVLQLGEIPD